MNILTFDEIIKMQEKLLEKIEGICKGVPLFKSNRMVKISNDSKIEYPVNILVNNAIESSKNDLTAKTTDLKSIIDEIKKIDQELSQIDIGNKSESLRNKQKGRLQKKIESKKENLNPEKRLELELEFYKIYADFYVKIAWIYNRLSHEGFDEFWSEKHINMHQAFTHALMGELESFNIRLDDDGIRCLDTGIFKPIPGIENFSGIEKEVSLHFGSESKYQEFLEQADGFLNTQALTRSELAYRAKLRLRYKHRQSTLTRKEEIPKEDKEPENDSDEEKIQVLVLQHIDLEKDFKKLKKWETKQENTERRNRIKKYLLSQCERNHEAKKIIFEMIEQTPTLDKDEDINLHDFIDEMNKILEIKSKKDIIELLTAHLDCISLIKERCKEDNEINKFLQIVQEFNECKKGEKKELLEKLLIYRCVGNGTEGEDAFFKTDEEGTKPVEQIRTFLNSLGIKSPDLEEQIGKAFDEKDALKEQGYDLGKQTLSQNDFIERLKQSMLKQEMTFDDIDNVIESYKDLDVFLGKDEDGVIDEIENIINEIIYGDSKRADFNELFEYTCDNNVEGFFEGLKKIVGEQRKKVNNSSDRKIDPTLPTSVASEPEVVAATNGFIDEITLRKSGKSGHDEL